MKFEVEQKHAVADLTAFLVRLEAQGIMPGPAVVQVDRYYAHPARDFARTDEALRIRAVGGESFVTYKGPKLDAETKTRRELELPLHADDGHGEQFHELLTALGFSEVATVRKRRRTFHMNRDGQAIEGALDEVDGVGTFVELELPADEGSLAAAKSAIAQLAKELQLGPSERRSYLELLLGK